MKRQLCAVLHNNRLRQVLISRSGYIFIDSKFVGALVCGVFTEGERITTADREILATIPELQRRAA